MAEAGALLREQRGHQETSQPGEAGAREALGGGQWVLQHRAGPSCALPAACSVFLTPVGWVHLMWFTDSEPTTQKVTKLPTDTQPACPGAGLSLGPLRGGSRGPRTLSLCANPPPHSPMADSLQSLHMLSGPGGVSELRWCSSPKLPPWVGAGKGDFEARAPCGRGTRGLGPGPSSVGTSGVTGA